MKIIRRDHVGSIDVRLVSRPTNTAAGVDNWHLYVDGATPTVPGAWVRFIGTDPHWAQALYESHIDRLRAREGQP